MSQAEPGPRAEMSRAPNIESSRAALSRFPSCDKKRLYFFVLCVLRPSIYFICIGLASNFCGMYGDRRRVGLPTSRARARVRRLTPTDRYPRDSNPGPLDLKSSILPLSYRPPVETLAEPGLKQTETSKVEPSSRVSSRETSPESSRTTIRSRSEPSFRSSAQSLEPRASKSSLSGSDEIWWVQFGLTYPCYMSKVNAYYKRICGKCEWWTDYRLV